MRLGAPFRQPEWSALALIEAPEYVTKVHRRYIDSGAEVITTNSYAVVPFHIGAQRFERDGPALAALAGRLARASADEAPRPHEFGWRWPHAFVDVGLKRLVDLGRVSRERADGVLRAFRESQAAPGAFSLNPTVLEIIAVKR